MSEEPEPRRLVREARRLIPEAVVDVLLGVLVMAVLVGVVVLAAWGWERSPQTTISAGAGVLTYITVNSSRRFNRFIVVAAGCVGLAIAWFAYPLF
ncbi:hypothetical protein [Actinokineospora sp. HUAS TT18]|uniref:hypothetical protein n=1 Tax=Actinokineospora sp. HUAS TT18 TaxID=3447451 RepID=UPI003F525156